MNQLASIRPHEATVAPAEGLAVDLSPCDVKVGELYAVMVPDHAKPIVLEFRKKLSTGVLRFSTSGTDQEFHFPIPQWEDMRSDGRAARIKVLGKGRSAEDIEDIDPLALLDPEDPSITGKERAKRLKAAERLQRARMLRFYVMRHDEMPAGKGRVGLRNFIDLHFQEAKAKKFFDKPSPQQIVRSLDGCGFPGERPLSAFLVKNGKHDKSMRWPQYTLDLALEMTTAYWARTTARQIDVISTFYESFDKENGRRAAARKDLAEERARDGRPGDAIPYDLLELKRPTKETLRLWIRATENYWSWREKHGETSARRRYRGHGKAIEAQEPLEYVMMDHTRLDAWAAVYDENGKRALVERPWLTIAVDVYSHMILGAVITFQGPSVYSALRCLRQVVRRKAWLVEQYGYHKGATDGWGKPLHVIVDNGWEWVGLSFQVCCEACGIHVIWAPVKTGEFKTHAERAFGILNELVWHRLEAGVPYKPHEMSSRELDPRPKAYQTVDWLFDRMWEAIVTIYHVEPHGEKRIVPAMRWRDGLLADGRPTIDDVRDLDKVLGKSKTVILSTSGVTLDGQRFHDQGVTTGLLNRLLYKERGKPRKGRSSGRVAMLGTWDPEDVSYILVWDWTRRENVRIPNVYPEYSRGLSWHTAKAIQKFVDEQNLDFQSDEEKYAARAAFDRKLREEHPHLEFRKARKNAAELSKPRLIDGEYVDRVTGEIGATEQGPMEIPQVMPANERSDDRIPDPGVRRGGAAATRASSAARARNRARKDGEKAATAREDRRGSAPMLESGLSETEASKRLSAIEDDL